MSGSGLLKEIAKIEKLLEDNMDATGSTFRKKIESAASQLPKGINEKLAFLADLEEKVRAGERLPQEDLKRAGFYVEAIKPYATHGAVRRSGWGAKIVWLAILIVALYVAYKFLAK
ncbi:MAG: hypothetical protein IJM30_02010 [Thermoguttaceae bacterium]|nr:hypothetical protein [Thermoguttaceae bacterium]